MKKSNTQIFRDIEQEVVQYENEVINSLLTESERNAKKIYSITFSKDEEKYIPLEWDIEKIEISYNSCPREHKNRPKINKRASEKDISLLMKHFECIKKSDKDIFFFTIRHHGKGVCLSGISLSDIRKKQEYAFSKEDLSPVLESKTRIYEEFYKHREGYTPCTYCHKQVPNDKIVKRTIIWRNGGKVVSQVMDFCSAECAFSEECAREG